MRARQFGAMLSSAGTEFRLWAPAAQSVELMLDRPVAMNRDADGWYRCSVPGVGAGTRYRFRIDGKTEVPDPASAFQPDDIGGASEVISHDYDWRAADWTGRPWHECVFSEIHVGTFTREGTFRAAIQRLDDLADAGITAVELMPVADFAGRRNWGYDGVLWYAPDSAYGRPEDLKALVDAAHECGLMIFLDVVYNHFGPEGNYLGLYAPEFFTDGQTPWGSAIDYAKAPVRAFAIENALQWIDTYRFDGLRLDAVHAIVAPGEPPLLEELSRAVGEVAAASGRHIHLVLENDDNVATLLSPQENPHAGAYRAQWDDDYHHAWHVMLTRETSGYYGDYAEAGPHLARCLKDGFAYQGEPSPHREGAPRGEVSAHLPAIAFVNFIQNHDQIGNRALGERLTILAEPESVAAALAVTLLAPSPPLLFMGEEWGAEQPFPFFCDFEGDLAQAVREGRRREFAAAYADPNADVPDPLAMSTFESARLDWSERNTGLHGERLALVRRLLQVRRDKIVPLLPLLTAETEAAWHAPLVSASWRLEDGRALRIEANLSGEPHHVVSPHAEVIWGQADDALPAWGVRAMIVAAS